MPVRGGRVYKTGGRERSLAPGSIGKKIFKWEMPSGLFAASPWDENRRDTGECGDDAAPIVTVSVCVRLGIDDSPGANKQDFPDSAPVNWSDASLLVTFGSSSGCVDDSSFEVDLLNGLCFSMVARDAEFYINYPVVEQQQGGIVQPIIDVSLAVGIGSEGSQGARPPRRTIKIGGLAGGAGNPSPTLPIPRFSVGAVYVSADGTAAATFNQRAAPFAGAALLSQSTIQKQEYQSIPIVNGARGFDIFTAAGSEGNAVLFYLAPA